MERERERKRERERERERIIVRKLITKTKKFLKKTLQKFQSFSKKYQMLPKTSRSSNHSHKHFDNLCTPLTDLSIKDNSKNQILNEPINTPQLTKKKDILPHQSFTSVGGYGGPSKNRHERNEGKTSSSEKGMKEERRRIVVEKLKELEKMSDMDHILDIEEVLYYYSRLNCHVFIDIVDRFFMEICSEFFVSSSPSIHSSTPERSKQITIKS